jgi:hypothetical protein
MRNVFASAPVPRRLIHTRDVRTRGFLRDDGLWDIEGELLDEKTYTYDDRERGPLPAGSPMHLMRARLTVDHELTVHAAEVDMARSPFSRARARPTLRRSCRQIAEARLRTSDRGRPWGARAAARTCATSSWRWRTRHTRRSRLTASSSCRNWARQGADGERPFFLNQCRAWDEKGEVVARFSAALS